METEVLLPEAEEVKQEKVRYPIRAPYNFVPFSDTVIFRYPYSSQLPRQDRLYEDLLSGEIHVKITAQTPIYISNNNRYNPDFNRDGRGNYFLPASTLRGLIRHNMQILGYGAVRSGRDYKNALLFHRNHTDAEQVWSPVRGGYLYFQRDRYFIRPAGAEVITVSRQDPVGQEFAEVHSRSFRMFYKMEEDHVTCLSAQAMDGCAQGMLLCPSEIRGKDPTMGNLYIFPAEDPAAPEVPLTSEAVYAYKDDYTVRRKYMKQEEAEFKALPERFVRDGDGIPVFYQQRGNFIILGKATMLRLAYEHPVGYGMPEQHKVPGLDYPDSILGLFQRRGSYRSRISVDNFAVRGDPEPMPLHHLPLQEPKPRFHDAYVRDGLSYNSEAFRLSGHKQYWLQNPPDPETIREKKTSTPIRPLPPGTVFAGSIRYRNLHPDELGLLLWCLKLEDGCMQSIGMGKPYGYGRVTVEITQLKEQSFSGLYHSFQAVPAETIASQTRIGELIGLYDACARQLAGFDSPIREQPRIQDFLYMKRTIREDRENVSYMSQTEHNRAIKGLKTVQSIREAPLAPEAEPET